MNSKWVWVGAASGLLASLACGCAVPTGPDEESSTGEKTATEESAVVRGNGPATNGTNQRWDNDSPRQQWNSNSPRQQWNYNSPREQWNDNSPRQQWDRRGESHDGWGYPPTGYGYATPTGYGNPGGYGNPVGYGTRGW